MLLELTCKLIFGVVSMNFVGKAPAAKPTPAKQNAKAPAKAQESSEEEDSDSDEDEHDAPAAKGVFLNFLRFQT